MDILCKACDREIFENESERKNYLVTLPKKRDKSFYTSYTISNVNLNER